MGLDDDVIDTWIGPVGERPEAPRTYHVRLAPDVARALELFARTTGKKYETILAEAARSYLGVDE